MTTSFSEPAHMSEHGADKISRYASSHTAGSEIVGGENRIMSVVQI